MNAEKLAAIVQKTANQMLKDALYEFNSPAAVKDALELGADPNGKILTCGSWFVPTTAMEAINNPKTPSNVYQVDLLTYTVDRHMYSMAGAEIFDLLLKFGAKANARNDDECSSVLATAKFLSPYYAVMYSRDTFNSPIMGKRVDFLKERTRVLEELVRRGADPAPLNKHGENVLHVTAYSVALERIEWLASIESFRPHFKAMLHTKDIKGMTPVSRLALVTTPFDTEEMVYRMYAKFVEHGANLNTRISDTNNLTIEDELLGNGFKGAWRKLIALQASVNNPCQDVIPRKLKL